MINKLILFIISASTIMASWVWIGAPIAMPLSPLTKEQRLYCVSYAPFRGNQTPLDPTTVIPAAQIEEDLQKLARLTDCVRIYSVDLGLENVPEIAARHGLKVLLGVWISSDAKRNLEQIRVGTTLAQRYQGTVRAVVVGNEVLLRGEMTAQGLEALIREVKARVPVPVTYADVWEFWMRNRQLSAAVDFVTVHILPYWEDHPIPARDAAAHIVSIYREVAGAFAPKDVIIGETGWPSAGRMREGALPSPAAQARVMHDLMAAARAEKFAVNLIEAFDQPWKRHLEGTVGGHWGLFSDAPRRAKFAWGEPVSNHPHWPWQAAAGVVLAAAVFAAAHVAGRRRAPPLRATDLASIATIAIVAGVLIGWTVEAALLESLGPGGWLRSILLTTTAILSPILAAAALARGVPLTTLQEVLGPPRLRSGDRLAMALGWIALLTTGLAIEKALGLTFNPRYLDFAFTSMTAAVVPLLILALANPRAAGVRPLAEVVVAGLLIAAAGKIVVMETVANWQAVWLAAALVALAATLARARAAPG